MLVVYLLAWLGLVVLAIINGAMREKLYGPRMGNLAAHQLSTVVALILFGLYVWVLSGTVPLASSAQAIAIGLTWLMLTVLFEFGFGHYVMKHPWSRLLADYNIFAGRLWVLVLLWTAMLPLLCRLLRV